MYKCRKCICRKCLNTCGCRDCQKTDGAVSFCKNYSQYEQLTLFAPVPKPVRQKLPRFVTWDDYGISKARYRELRELCRSRKYDDMVRSAAYKANPEIAEYIVLSVRDNVSYDNFCAPKYTEKLGGIYVCRTDFYGYRRLFYHHFDEALKNGTNSIR